MEPRYHIPYFFTLLFIPVAAGLRLWSLLAAVDEQGLPAMHLSMYALIAAAAVFLLAAAVFSFRSPGRSGQRSVIRYGPSGFVCALAAACLILLGAVLEFSEELAAGPGFFTAIVCLLGLLGGLCCIVTALARRSDSRRIPGAEMAPVLYLLVKLILDFKGWSTDPIILDYCVRLFAMIFALLAFLRGAGFVLDAGRPRRTLFFAMGAVFFCAAALMDGILTLSLASIATFLGILLWQLPLIWDLLEPHAPDPEAPAEDEV